MFGMNTARFLKDYIICKKRQYKDIRKLRKEQWKKTKAIIKYAYDNVPYYHTLFKRSKITPNDIQAFSDMKKIPVSDKHSIRTASPHDIIARGYTKKDYLDGHTSGSTGEPLHFVKDRTAFYMESLVRIRTNYNNIRIKWNDKIVQSVVTKAKPNKYTKISGLNKLFNIITNVPVEELRLSIWLDADEQIKLLEKYQPDAIRGYASEFRKWFVLSKNRDINISPRICCSKSEILFEEERELFEKKFNTKLFREYGSLEFGEIAGECYEEKSYHMNIDNLFFEFVKDGDYVSEGEEGEIIITYFYNHAMPFIRYKIGDMGIYSHEKCLCGRSLPVLEDVIGRTTDMIVSPNGELIPPLYFSTHFRYIKGLNQAQLVQEKQNLLVLNLVVTDDFDREKSISYLEDIYKQRMGEITLKVNFLDEIPREKSGKYRLVKSNIPVKF